MFTKIPVAMKKDGETKGFFGLINTDYIVNVFSQEEGNSCSVMMTTGDKVYVDLSFTEFSERLLSMSKSPLDA